MDTILLERDGGAIRHRTQFSPRDTTCLGASSPKTGTSGKPWNLILSAASPERRGHARASWPLDARRIRYLAPGIDSEASRQEHTRGARAGPAGEKNKNSVGRVGSFRADGCAWAAVWLAESMQQRRLHMHESTQGLGAGGRVVRKLCAIAAIGCRRVWEASTAVHNSSSLRFERIWSCLPLSVEEVVVHRFKLSVASTSSTVSRVRASKATWSFVLPSRMNLGDTSFVWRARAGTMRPQQPGSPRLLAVRDARHGRGSHGMGRHSGHRGRDAG